MFAFFGFKRVVCLCFLADDLGSEDVSLRAANIFWRARVGQELTHDRPANVRPAMKRPARKVCKRVCKKPAKKVGGELKQELVVKSLVVR